MRRDRHLHIFHNDPVSFNAILSKALQLLEEIHGSHFAREAVIEIRVEDLLLLLCRTVYDKVNPSSRKTASRLQRRHHDEREDQRGLPHLRLQGLSELFQGFPLKDYPSFFRAFRKAYGMSPKEYREAFSLSELQQDNP